MRVPWTGERLRTLRGRRGLTQGELRDALSAIAPDGKRPSGTSVSDWETDKTKPGTKWAALLDQFFADDMETELALAPEQGTPNDEVDLTHVDDLHLLAEVARRMATHNRQTSHLTPLPRLRWARTVLPSAKHPEKSRSHPDNGDPPGVTSSSP